MKTIRLDLTKMVTKEEAHSYLKDIFLFPSYYGNNLDALYDSLTDITEDIEIVLPRALGEERRLGNYGKKMLRVFRDGAEDNEHLHICEI